MVSQQLIDYIKSAMDKGYSTSQIYNNLVQYGYRPDDASMAINVAAGNSSAMQMSSNTLSQEPMPDPERKSIRLLPFLFLGILVLAIAGGAFFYFKPFSNEANMQAPGNELLNPGTNNGQGQSEVAAAGKENCGSVDNMHIFVAPEEKTDAEVQAMSCFSQDLYACNPSIFELVGTNGASFEVIQKEGDNCLISTTGKTCKVPLSYIQKIRDAANQQGTPEMGFVPIIFVFSMGNPTDTETGETIVIDCY